VLPTLCTAIATDVEDPDERRWYFHTLQALGLRGRLAPARASRATPGATARVRAGGSDRRTVPGCTARSQRQRRAAAGEPCPAPPHAALHFLLSFRFPRCGPLYDGHRTISECTMIVVQ